jgi:hypothetical protein
MRRAVRTGLAALAMLAGAGAASAEQACFIAYSGFEEKVPHLDLDLCPGGQVTPEQGFCRIALSDSAVVVYIFRHGAGEPCLARADRYEFNDFVARFGMDYAKP